MIPSDCKTDLFLAHIKDNVVEYYPSSQVVLQPLSHDNDDTEFDEQVITFISESFIFETGILLVIF